MQASRCENRKDIKYIVGSKDISNTLVLRRLLGHGVRVDVKDHDGREPLMWAASAGTTDAIVTLANSGASVSARDKGTVNRSFIKNAIV